MNKNKNLIFPDLAEVLPNHVAVVCGGGSGHEPAFAGKTRISWTIVP